MSAPSAIAPLEFDELIGLKRYDVPTVANAIEALNVRPRNAGFMSPEVRCIFPKMGVMAGYAVTARYRAAEAPAAGEQAAVNFDWWDFVLRTPAPRVVVIQDMDAAPAVGSFWGEVQANIHKALGCIGAVTNGGVRDLKEVAELGFQLYARDVLVSHAYGRMIDFGSPVEVGGLTIKTGDLVHADRHGVQLIPIGAARGIPQAAERLIARERRIIAYCQSPGFTADGLNQLMKAL